MLASLEMAPPLAPVGPQGLELEPELVQEQERQLPRVASAKRALARVVVVVVVLTT